MSLTYFNQFRQTNNCRILNYCLFLNDVIFFWLDSKTEIFFLNSLFSLYKPRALGKVILLGSFSRICSSFFTKGGQCSNSLAFFDGLFLSFNTGVNLGCLFAMSSRA